MDGVHSRIINFERLCRLCLQEKRILMSIYDSVDDNHNLGIYEKIMACAKIVLSKDDGLPARICVPCLSSLNAAFEFRLQCENADRTLHDIYHLLVSNQPQKGKESKGGDNEKPEDEQELEKTQVDGAGLNKIIVIRSQEKEVYRLENSKCVDESEEEETEIANLSDVMDIMKENKQLGESVIEMNINDEKGIGSNDSFDSLAIQIEGEEAMPENLTELNFSAEGCLQETSGPIPHSSEKAEGQSTNSLGKKKPLCDGKKSSCPFCQKMLTRVNEHIRLLHRNKVYICKKSDCGAEFLTLKNLQSHQLRCYNMEKPYKCLNCSKEFYRKCNYNAHTRRHSNRKDFQCQLCEKAFVDSTGLRRHFLKHHEPQQEVYVVGCCGKKFKTKKGLKQHIERGICRVQILHTLDYENAVT